MLSTFHQPSALGPAPLLMSSPFRDFHWPVRSLWPETRPLFYQLEQEMLRHFQLMKQNMDYMKRLHQRIWEEIDQSAAPASLAGSSLEPITFQMKEDQGGAFALTLNTKDYTPEELSIKQVGRKLRVSGRSESKQEVDGHSSHRLHQFRQEFHLPEGVNPESVTCSLDGGLLCIQAPCEKDPAGSKERVVPITLTSPWEELLSTTATTPKTTRGQERTSTTPKTTVKEGRTSTTAKTTAGERLVPITVTLPEELMSTTTPSDTKKTETNYKSALSGP